MRKKAIVIGSGAGGAMAAKELQGQFDVTILEAGRNFTPLAFSVDALAKLRKTGLFLDERMIQLLFPAMKIRKPFHDYVVVNGVCLGGSTAISAGNGVCADGALRALGIHLDQEFEQLYQEIPLTTTHRFGWNKTTRSLFCICKEMGLAPQVAPKMIEEEKCTLCGKCVLGCQSGAKWDSRRLIDTAVAYGAKVITGCKVQSIHIEHGRAKAVVAVIGGRKKRYYADCIVLAAGGLGTPDILARSKIPCLPSLFLDPVLCVCAVQQNARLNQQLPMPFLVQQDHYIMSPYFDYLSFFFNKKWNIPAQNILSMMIKLADQNVGDYSDHKVKVSMTNADKRHFKEAVALCREILIKAGARPEELFLGTVNAGHPGGMLPLTAKEAVTLHHESLPANLYVADATLFPSSLGNPPILTIMALAKRIAAVIKEGI
jgi:choline dehydrogenase-like flavoprotein